MKKYEKVVFKNNSNQFSKSLSHRIDQSVPTLETKHVVNLSALLRERQSSLPVPKNLNSLFLIKPRF